MKAGRAMMNAVVAHHNMAPKVVLSDFATRILPTLRTEKKANRPVKIAAIFAEEPPLDPRDFGYRVVAPVPRPPLYTSVHVPAEPETDYLPTNSTLGRIICRDDCAAQEIMAAQQEWDSELDMEPTRPHFEYYKEDPYNGFDSMAASDLFACIDSHDDTEGLWEQAA